MDQHGAVAGFGTATVWRVLPNRTGLSLADLTGTLGRAAAVSLLAHTLLAALLGAPVAGRQPGSGADVRRSPLHARLSTVRPAVSPAPLMSAGELTDAAGKVDPAAPSLAAPTNRSAAGDAAVPVPAQPQRVVANTPETPAAPVSPWASALPFDGLPAPRYYLPREVDHPAAPLEHAHLVYPEDALKRRIGGVVVMHLYIGSDGRLDRTEVVRAEPPGVFEDAVRDAAAASRFRAAMLGQRAVSSRVTIEVPFDANCSDFETCASRAGSARPGR